MIRDYVPRDAALSTHFPSLLVCWFQIWFLTWLGEKWVDKYVTPFPFNKLWPQIKLEEAWEKTFPHSYSLEPPGP